MIDPEAVSASVVDGVIGQPLMTVEGQQQRVPTYLAMLEAVPGMPTMMANNMRRGGSTLLKGGRRTNASGGMIRRGIRHNNPIGIFRRYDSTSLFDPVGPGRAPKGYSPFQISDTVNAVDRGLRGASVSDGRMASLGKALGSADYQAANRAADKGPLMDRGSFARVNASARIMAGAKYANGPLGGLSRTAAAQQVLGQMEGRWTGQVGGYMARTTVGLDTWEDGVKKSNQAWKGFERARDDINKLGLGDNYTMRQVRGAAFADDAAKGAKAAGARLVGATAAKGAARFAGPVGAVLLAHDLGRMAGAVVGGTARAASSTYAELRNPMIAAPFQGNGFRETQASLTSRQRGVMQIQNSRLNARSVLGNEASVMAGYF